MGKFIAYDIKPKQRYFCMCMHAYANIRSCNSVRRYEFSAVNIYKFTWLRGVHSIIKKLREGERQSPIARRQHFLSDRVRP